jgi:hypothetical protein
MFYCDQMLQFQVAVSDPTQHNMVDAEAPYHRWYRLSFHNEGGVSRVDIAGNEYYLYGEGTSWAAQLGLETYCYEGESASQGLAGNLGILIALIAFSSWPGSLDDVLMCDKAWDRYRWNGHPYQHGSKL